jgi:succinate dehydrogenase/fumarate reductase cytochrome b subunit
MGLILVVAVHLLNGLRITIVDFFLLTRSQKSLFWASVFLFTAVLILTAVIFLPKIL